MSPFDALGPVQTICLGCGADCQVFLFPTCSPLCFEAVMRGMRTEAYVDKLLNTGLDSFFDSLSHKESSQMNYQSAQWAGRVPAQSSLDEPHWNIAQVVGEGQGPVDVAEHPIDAGTGLTGGGANEAPAKW